MGMSKVPAFFVVLLKRMIWQLDQRMKMTVFAFWFDSNKELHCKLSYSWGAGHVFVITFIIQMKSYM